MKRLRVGVLYGGRSGEHEVSIASAASVFAHLDRKRYEPVPIRIEKDGRWALADKPPANMIAGDVIEQARESFGIDPVPFAKLLDLREERIKARDLEPQGLLDSYLKQISIVIDAVDRLEK